MSNRTPDQAQRKTSVFIGCRHCRHSLTAAEIIERFCEKCTAMTEPTEIRDGGWA